jgi:hypothetical protein
VPGVAAKAFSAATNRKCFNWSCDLGQQSVFQFPLTNCSS